MKLQGLWMAAGIVCAISMTACVGSSQRDRNAIPPGDPVIGLLNKGIAQLNVNINTVSKRMNEVQQTSPGSDPVLQELQALDLSGWQLHQKQWALQRDHLVLARDILQQVQTNPGDKGQLLNRWREHWQQYVTAYDELREQRHTLESKHREIEARLIERRLQ